MDRTNEKGTLDSREREKGRYGKKTARTGKTSEAQRHACLDKVFSFFYWFLGLYLAQSYSPVPEAFSDYVLHLPLSVSGVTDTESDRLRGITNNKVDNDPWGTGDKGGDSFDSYVSRAPFVPSSTIHPLLPPTLTPPK